ncbi:MAG: hypothetical protein IJ125_03615 [Atopobiaceae bacterium]|nr:hypothetical protein [Atopobiaceae bacterium]
MTRGDKELHCLERVKRYVFPDVSNPTAEDADMSLLYSSAFGFSSEDWQEFCSVLVAAEPNSKPNEFPDFISRDSLFEHFEISATQEGRKGSTFKRKYEPFLKSVYEEAKDAAASDELKTIARAFSYPDRKHELLLDSLKRNLGSHIESFETYAASHEVATLVFIIELQEHGLSMIENIYDEVGSGRVFGDIREQQKFDNYRLSRDKEALELLHAFADEIDIVIFAGVDDVEIIKLCEIPNMLRLLPWPFVIAAGPTIERHSFLPVIQTIEEVTEQEEYEQD